MDADESSKNDQAGAPEAPAPPPSSPPALLPADPPRGGPQEQQVLQCTDVLLRGDFREARLMARQLLAASPLGEAERSFAEQVLRRTDVDPVALGVGLTSFLLFWLIVYLTVWR